MSSPGVNNNAPQVRIQIQAQQQAAHQQQQLSSNQTQNQQLANHQHGMKNAMPAQSQNVSHAGTYYSNAGTNGKADLSANVQNAANAATAYDLLRRMIRGEAVSPAQELDRIKKLYSYLKKFIDEQENGELSEEETQDILSWFGHKSLDE